MDNQTVDISFYIHHSGGSVIKLNNSYTLGKLNVGNIFNETIAYIKTINNKTYIEYPDDPYDYNEEFIRYNKEIKDLGKIEFIIFVMNIGSLYYYKQINFNSLYDTFYPNDLDRDYQYIDINDDGKIFMNMYISDKIVPLLNIRTGPYEDYSINTAIVSGNKELDEIKNTINYINSNEKKLNLYISDKAYVYTISHLYSDYERAEMSHCIEHEKYSFFNEFKESISIEEIDSNGHSIILEKVFSEDGHHNNYGGKSENNYGQDKKNEFSKLKVSADDYIGYSIEKHRTLLNGQLLETELYNVSNKSNSGGYIFFIKNENQKSNLRIPNNILQSNQYYLLSMFGFGIDDSFNDLSEIKGKFGIEGIITGRFRPKYFFMDNKIKDLMFTLLGSVDYSIEEIAKMIENTFMNIIPNIVEGVENKVHRPKKVFLMQLLYLNEILKIYDFKIIDNLVFSLINMEGITTEYVPYFDDYSSAVHKQTHKELNGINISGISPLNTRVDESMDIYEDLF